MSAPILAVEIPSIFLQFGPRRALREHALSMPKLQHALHPESRSSWAATAWSDLGDVHAWLMKLNRAVAAESLEDVQHWVPNHPAGQGWTELVSAVAQEAAELVDTALAHPATEQMYGFGDLAERVQEAWDDAVDEYLREVEAARPDDAQDVLLGIAETVLGMHDAGKGMTTDGEWAWGQAPLRAVRDLGFDAADLRGMRAALDAADSGEEN
ncbi:hypothetical protein [Mycobacteroides abscessus]|uniref:hypothetical protein n=1 Tax=Mycobacteroides abscessus TaxID=36809 RepID=UPI0002684382|nr:hypothetical protein [Mycobacteroides abscessus]EIV25329.1 hypothetical protein MA3A0119R_2685 [Mycobacteroides abscessus 3A-0119-R]EIV29644.1 hypothetical protein MA3A0122R_2748 [Mycobacteroides abscessus 3A-0122-R]EIV36430.1 hypothetical protein MA3A0122S_2303 [Mycobacteroides abscessus 3A-0122-S]EIV38606.1 hypothetical protein MA3A0731_2843 [Mycobacteroides abscessus 3A-0731]EIV53582.1 hypothetical protein MA3A0930S_2713 [Mycobacteroides abscessus 3A-0930-S]